MPDPLPPVPVLNPSLQISFYYRLTTIRSLWLHQALQEAVEQGDLDAINADLSSLVSAPHLARVARFGLRGEVLFATPTLLRRKPSLLGYYRLLLGFSQKEFYGKGRFGPFKRMEEKGEIPPSVADQVPDLCRSLSASAAKLADMLDRLSLDLIHELQLLTLGPQLRGSENTRIGKAAAQEVFDLIRTLVGSYLREQTRRTLILENDSGRRVVVEFSSDPDIAIVEKLPSGVRPLVSVEIKGGSDVSNVHNRIGEAEKSHQKAKDRGFFEFWTIIRASIPQALAQRQSPTTSRFFSLDSILQQGTPDRLMFQDTLGSVLGIHT